MVVEAVSLRRIEDGERRSSPHSPASDDEPGLTSIPTLSGATRSSIVTNNPASGRLRHPSLPLPFPPKETSYRLNSAFFLFGLLNNSLYVVILTAALELLPQGVPTGLVSFANIFPALIAKAVWPYLLRGTVRYTKRVWSCAGLSFVGMLLVSFFPALGMRLLGISLASFSSGLGELTFLQLSTRYAPKEGKGLGLVGLETNYAGDAVGWFASGTGAAGLVGAGAWWAVRGLGVQTGMAILSVLPGFMVLAYLVVCPSVEALLFVEGAGGGSGAGYAPISTSEDVAEEQADETVDAESDTEEREDSTTPLTTAPGNIRVRLSFNEKMTLLRPMLLRYILPLVTVYFAEYTINQGVAPTLIYPLPTPSSHPLLSIIIKKLTDYYPLYQLVYQTFVFLSRSSISIFNLPAIPRNLLWLPAVLQTGLLFILASESLYGWFRASIASPLVIVLICIEGLAGGAAYVSVFYSIGVDGRNGGNRIVLSADATQEAEGEYEEDKAYALAKKAQEHEFRIGCVGFGDSLGILAASIISMPLQVGLCNAQARDGRELCKQA
ncbi:related to YHC3 - protein involved in vacuolar arginine transport [Ustilago sp. UG-2017b]|nr:related to YHC3 - protein involved in vacuolar arginine transport [Ustilago sp. UG-2017b]